MWVDFYLGVLSLTFVVTLAFAFKDTFQEHKFYKDVFSYDIGRWTRIEDYAWDFCLAFVLAALWPLFLVGLICGGMTWPFR